MVDNKWELAIIAMVCLTIIEITALYFGQNGTTLSLIVGAIGAIFGACIGVKLKEYADGKTPQRVP